MAEKTGYENMIIWLCVLAFLFVCASIFLYSIPMLLSGICFVLVASIIAADYDDL